jgi:DHA1 family multidrug resistance protein-like MFS transporter
MFTAQFISIVGFAFVLPFIPFYIRELGVTDESLVPIWAGILGAVTSLVMAIFSPLWGWLADRYGRKIMVERAMFGGAILTMGMGLVGNVYQLLVLRLLAGATQGTISASISLVSSVVPKHKLGFSLGLMQVAVFLGMTLGPWIGGVLADTLGYRYTFIVGGFLLLLGGMLVLIGARERFLKPSEESLKRNGSLLNLFSHPGFKIMLCVFFFFNLAVYNIMPIFPLFVESIGHLIKTKVASMTGMLLAISGGTAAVAAGAIGYLSDRTGYKRILSIMLLWTSFMCFIQGMAQNINQLIIIRVFYGLGVGGVLPTMNALVGRIVPHDSYGKAYGMTSSMTCLGMAVGPLTGGILASLMGYRWPFILGGILLVGIVFPVVSSIRHK